MAKITAALEAWRGSVERSLACGDYPGDDGVTPPVAPRKMKEKSAK